MNCDLATPLELEVRPTSCRIEEASSANSRGWLCLRFRTLCCRIAPALCANAAWVVNKVWATGCTSLSWPCLISFFCALLADSGVELGKRLITQIILLLLVVAFLGCWFVYQINDFLLGQGIVLAASETSAPSNISLEPPSSSSSSRPRQRRKPKSLLIAERIQQLNERTRICSRQVWEDSYLVGLKGREVAEKMKPSMAQCCICVCGIEMTDQVRGMACGHSFHLPCLAQWFMQDRSFVLSCPLCRIPLSEQGSFPDCTHEEGSIGAGDFECSD